MAKFKIFKLGQIATDTATKVKGTLTMALIDMNRSVMYSVQPKKLTDDGIPVKAIWLAAARLEGGELIEVDLPLDVLGTEVEDTATGFKGTAINLFLHHSGCVHVDVQPKGEAKDGNPVESRDFYIWRLKGKAIPKQSEKQLEKQQLEKPSPAGDSPFRVQHREMVRPPRY